MTDTKKMYINGELVAGQSVCDVVNPATDAVVAKIAVGGVEQANAALKAAQSAFSTWSKSTVEERTQWMFKLQDAVVANEQLLRECVHLEMGKSWADTQEDFDCLVNSLSFYAEYMLGLNSEMLPDRSGGYRHELRREPIGVVAAFLAWNFPLLNIAYKLGPAMASGCPIVIKPSLKTPLSAYVFGELCAPGNW